MSTREIPNNNNKIDSAVERVAETSLLEADPLDSKDSETKEVRVTFKTREEALRAIEAFWRNCGEMKPDWVDEMTKNEGLGFWVGESGTRNRTLTGWYEDEHGDEDGKERAEWPVIFRGNLGHLSNRAVRWLVRQGYIEPKEDKR